MRSQLYSQVYLDCDVMAAGHCAGRCPCKSDELFRPLSVAARQCPPPKRLKPSKDPEFVPQPLYLPEAKLPIKAPPPPKLSPARAPFEADEKSTFINQINQIFNPSRIFSGDWPLYFPETKMSIEAPPPKLSPAPAPPEADEKSTFINQINQIFDPSRIFAGDRSR